MRNEKATALCKLGIELLSLTKNIYKEAVTVYRAVIHGLRSLIALDVMTPKVLFWFTGQTEHKHFHQVTFF